MPNSGVGAAWPGIHAVLLTHTHGDHWNERTFAYLHRLRIPLFLHADHQQYLGNYCSTYESLEKAGLLRGYVNGAEFEVGPGLRCRPVAVRHDGGPTFGFRFEGPADLFGQPCSLGYAADLGCWDDGLADLLADVDLLAVEFNHDVALERASGRMPRLIARVLGDDGHLSNEQGAALVRAVLERSANGRLKHVVQLHLSRDCNRPDLAAEAAWSVLGDREGTIEVHTASQDRPGPTLTLGVFSTRTGPSRRRPQAALPRKQPRHAAFGQPLLPGFEA